MNQKFDHLTFRVPMLAAQYNEIIKGVSSGAKDLVWSLPFNEAATVSTSAINELEQVAEYYGIILERRKFEDDIPSHKQSTQSRNKFQISQQQSQIGAVSHAHDFCKRRFIQLDTDSLLLNDPNARQQIHGELINCVGTSQSFTLSDSTMSSSAVPNQTPQVLFRAYSEQSFGINSTTLFRAGRFSSLYFPALPIPSPNSLEFYIDAAHHLTRQVTAGPFVSVSSSLIWTLHMAYRKGHKTVAIIHGPSASSHSSVYAVPPLLSTLKNTLQEYNGISLRYHGAFEFLVWAEIPEEAIICGLQLHHLESLARKSKAVTRVLRLDVLKNSTSVSVARSKYLRDPIVLDGEVGQAMGKIIALFGFSPNSDGACTCISEMVFHLLQGWAIMIPTDEEAIEQSFATFQYTISSSIGPLAFQVSQSLWRAYREALADALVNQVRWRKKTGATK
jgi:hypothetical protein